MNGYVNRRDSAMSVKNEAARLVAQMTLEEKASLCSGLNFWYTKGVERLGLTPVMMTDGPHGLRKQEHRTDHLGMAGSAPATCFPAACATAASFDSELLAEIGRAMGDEALQENVSIILGPGANIKRSPLCGRNFEYFSEDPLLSGTLAGAMICGIQEKNIGTSLKHFAANNQETRRMSINAVVDIRALREIYLKSFELALKIGEPWTVMCSYNLLNGIYASDSKWLLTDVLRDDWGFDGIVVSDWGAVSDRVEGVLAGMDLEMPSSKGFNDARIVAAVNSGRITQEDVDKVAVRMTELILKSQAAQKSGYSFDSVRHHALARKSAAESCVLLKNDGEILPLKKGCKLAVIGEFAKTPRYQGSGSSKINPTHLDNAHDELIKLGFEVTYAVGYDGLDKNDAFIAAAVSAAKEADVAVIFAGLPDEYESEGFDRETLDMPDSHTALIRAVAAAKPETVVVLQLGSPVSTLWAEDVKGLMVSYLGGQAGGGGTADVLSGVVNPGGRLPETWPLKLEDTPCYHSFPGGGKTVEYRESIFVGYRYYETAKKPVAWPFGYGLSYTAFGYSGIGVSAGALNVTAAGNAVTRAAAEAAAGNAAEITTEIVTVNVTVTNTGSVAGAETVQIYLSLPDSKIYRPIKWLAAFEKVRLAPNESKTLKIRLDSDAFKYYNGAAGDWRTEGGRYIVSVGASVRDIRLAAEIDITGDGDEALLSSQSRLGYQHLTGNSFSEADFIAIYGSKLPPPEYIPGTPYTVNSTLNDAKGTQLGDKLIAFVKKVADEKLGLEPGDIAAMLASMVMDAPLRGLSMFVSDMVPPNFAEILADALNGAPIPDEFARLLYTAPQ